jgi:hypothetical protein
MPPPLSILERTNITKSCKAIRPVVTQKPKGPVLSTMSFISASTLRDSVPYILPIGLIGLWRWALFAIRILFWLLYRPLYPKKNPDGTSANVYKSTDVTIIVPTIDNGKEFMEAAEIWLRNRPFEVIIVTSETMREELSRTCATIDPDLFRVLSVPKPNKRVQLMKGIHAAPRHQLSRCPTMTLCGQVTFSTGCLRPSMIRKWVGLVADKR